jgi:hypothetical protein
MASFDQDPPAGRPAVPPRNAAGQLLADLQAAGAPAGNVQVAKGQVIASTWGNTLWNQSVQVFASTADRDNQFPNPPDGAQVYTAAEQAYWVRVAGVWGRMLVNPHVQVYQRAGDGLKVGELMLPNYNVATTAAGTWTINLAAYFTEILWASAISAAPGSGAFAAGMSNLAPATFQFIFYTLTGAPLVTGGYRMNMVFRGIMAAGGGWPL